MFDQKEKRYAIQRYFDGVSGKGCKNYDQQKNYDQGSELPGLPVPPVRLTAGYLLDRTGSQYVRTQIARPGEKTVDWCAALVPVDLREEGAASWTDVTAQRRIIG